MKRKVFLALALFAFMAVAVFAQTEADFGVLKSADGKSIEIIEYKGTAKDVKIPEKIQNLPVTKIGGFENNNNITSITIPNGVTTIGDSALMFCTSLTSVTIGSGVKIIEKNAFDGCASLTSVTIPNSVTSIGLQSFRNCPKLTSVTIGNGVTSIGSQTFQYARSLTSVTFGGTIPSSGFNANAFTGLGDIRDKYLAAGGGAGTYTRQADSTTWTKGASAAAPAAAGTPGLAFALTSDGKGYRVSKGTVTSGTSGNLVIPATYNNLPVTTIDPAAFLDLVLISSVVIPESVTNIGIAAFANCASLNSITFGRANTSFSAGDFPEGDLAQKYKAGGAGTYTKSGKTWTKK